MCLFYVDVRCSIGTETSEVAIGLALVKAGGCFEASQMQRHNVNKAIGLQEVQGEAQKFYKYARNVDDVRDVEMFDAFLSCGLNVTFIHTRSR
jgi:hypothetical protein